MDERPRCPECNEFLIEGECIQHGVIVERVPDLAPQDPPPPPVSTERPSERARVVTPEGGGPSYVVFEPESVARDRELQMEAARGDAEQTAAVREAPAPIPEAAPPGSQDMIVIDQKPVWIVVVAAAVLVLFVLVSLWRGQSLVGSRLDDLRASMRLVDDRLGTIETFNLATDARLKRVERRLGGTFNVAQLAKRVTPAVFTIRTSQGVGSGFVVERGKTSSTLLTNFHVIASVGRGGAVLVDQKGRRTINGRVGKVDPDNDLAAVVVKRRLPVLPLLHQIPKAGEPVIAVGSPLGLGGTVTEGIVSGRVQGLIQFSAAASFGSSGGPLVNAKGQVIGVVTLKIIGAGAEGLAFAVPSSRACSRILDC
jgi:hypothetical protein